MKDIAIFGAGGFGREVKIIIDKINQEQPNTYNLLGFYDDGREKGELVNGFPVLGGVREINEVKKEMALAISIGDPRIKAKILDQINNPNIDYPAIIHPKASFSTDDVIIGKGTIICEGTILTCNIEVGEYVIFNLLCTVGHDTKIGDYSAFMPGVNISGEVTIGKGAYVGTGAKVINLLEIGEGAIIGAGAVVSKSIPANCTAVGIPAKPIKFHS